MLNEPPRQRLVTHTGFLVERVSRVLSDAQGNLLLQTDLGPAAIDDRDIGQLQLSSGANGETLLLMEHYRAGARADGDWRIEDTMLSGASALGADMGFVAEPVTPETGPAAPAPPGA